MRLVLPIALLATAVVNVFFFLWIVFVDFDGSWLDYLWLVVNGLSAYGCWVAGKHLLRQAREVARQGA